MTQRVRAIDLREAIADALYPLKSYQLPAVCERYGLAPGTEEEAYGSKRWYVLRRIEEWQTPALVSLAVRILEDHHSDALQDIVTRAGLRGVDGEFKNLIFAADGPKPEIVLRDAVNNVIEIVKNAQFCLIYDRPLPPEGLRWGALVSWWCGLQGVDPGDEPIHAARLLFNRLNRSLDSEVERRLFHTYAEFYRNPEDFGRAPALIPQVYLHYDPYTRARASVRPGQLIRQRMDFLLLLPENQRIVIEVDGQQHYADDDGRAQPRRYAEMVAEDRKLRLAGYEVYRFGGYELSGDRAVAAALARDFFQDLFDRHNIEVSPR